MQRSYVIRERPLAPQDYDVPVGWWGWNWEPPIPMSISELLAAGNMDARTAALCWMVLEAHGSLLIAAEQPHSGKTTTVTAFLDFLPNEIRRVFVRGWAETFDFIPQTDPQRTLLLINELSSHLPVYLWGPKAVHVFRALRRGYALVGTLHADSAAEAVEQMSGELGVERGDLARVDLLLVMRIFGVARTRARAAVPATEVAGVDGRGSHAQSRYAPLARRVVSMHRLQPQGQGPSLRSRGPLPPGAKRPGGVHAVPLVTWDQRRDAHDHFEAAELELLRHRLGGDEDGSEPLRRAAQLREELHRRTAYLNDLVERGVQDIPAVREALASYRGESVPIAVRGDPTV